MFLLGGHGVGRGRQFEEQSQSSDLRVANHGREWMGSPNASGEVQPVPDKILSVPLFFT